MIVDMAGDEVVLWAEAPLDCGEIQSIDVDETPQMVRIEVYVLTRQRGVCPDMNTRRFAVVHLDGSLSDRRLVGCTFDAEGLEPGDIDCREWP